MARSDDEDRPKRSWREIDQMRSGARPRDEARPRGRWAEAQARRATAQYTKQLDALFSSGQGGARGEELAAAMREAHGGPDLATACRAYRDEVGVPDAPDLLGLFLDTGDRELVVAALELLLARARAGEDAPSKGLRRQVETLAQDFDAAIADVAEELLEALAG
ncbi:MAG: hypothetical protein R3E88_00885 [Myxococcota bacterium]